MHLGLRKKIADLLETAKGTSAAHDPAVRQKLARIYLEGELLKLVSERAISGALHGREMGPESSIAKLVWSEAEQHLGEVAGDVLGPDANTGRWGRDRLAMRSYTIAGGKNARARVQRVGAPDTTELRLWAAHERIAVRRG